MDKLTRPWEKGSRTQEEMRQDERVRLAISNTLVDANTRELSQVWAKLNDHSQTTL